MATKASNSEMLVLSTLISMREATAADLHKELAKTQKWAMSTVMTFLRRLEEKKLVEHERRAGSRAFIYHPSPLARPSRIGAIRDFIDRLFGGDPLPLVSTLIDDNKLDDEQIRELRGLIDKRLNYPESKK